MSQGLRLKKNCRRLLFLPLQQRLAEHRPVLAKSQIMELVKNVVEMTTGDTVSVSVTHTVRLVTRVANGQVLYSDDGDDLEITLVSQFGDRQGVVVKTNQLDESTLRATVQQCELLARETIGPDEVLLPQPQRPDLFIPVRLWHESTIQAMTGVRDVVVPEVLDAVKREQLRGAGFLGLMARSEASMTKEGITAYNEETDSEFTVTTHTQDEMSSGWGGQAARDWLKIKPMEVATTAVEWAKRGANPVALEPGRRTAILSPAAVIQIIRFMARELDAAATDLGYTGFSRTPRGNKLGQRVFNPRVTMSSNPADPDGGYRPYFWMGYANPSMTWIEHGVLKNLAYGVSYAMSRGKIYAEQPWSIRLSGETSSIADMIAQCKEGVYVNRFSSVSLVDLRTGLMTGVTRDGCFLIKNGKFEKPVKNFRFLDSPFFFLNNIEALGVSERAAFGYTPPEPGVYDPFSNWPRRPIIVPPMMVRDFNFSALVDAT